MGSTRFPAYRVAHGLGLRCSTAWSSDHIEHIANCHSVLRTDRTNADHPFFSLDQTDWHDLPISCKNCIGLCQLKQTGGQTIAIAHGGLFKGTPSFVGAQTSCNCTWKWDLRLLSKPYLGIHLPHIFRCHLHCNFDCANIARLLNDL